MIQFTLRCPADHRFDSWFSSAEAFDSLQAAGHISCAVCGAAGVEKAVMAPRVQASRDRAAPVQPDRPRDAPARPLAAPASPAEQALDELRRRIEARTEDVGRNFAAEARAIHEGEAPDRPIRGEARLDEAKSLLEDGVPVMPLPFPARRRTN